MNAIAASIVESVWRASWQGAIAIAAVWLVCRMWKRIPSSIHCALWLLVCLKLIITLTPVAISVPCLPASNLQRSRSSSVTEPDLANRELQINAGQKIAHQPIPLPSVGDVGESEERRRTGRGRFPVSVVISPHPSKPWLIPTTYLATLWFLGVLCVGTYATRQLINSLRLIRKASPCTNSDVLSEVEELRKALGLHIKPTLLITTASSTVLTVGALRPVVLISAETISRCTPQEMRMILAHEFAHIRRKDAWLGLIPLCAQTLFFFHPMVWLACREFSFAREAACDEEAIACLQIGSDLYGRLLLKLGSQRQTATTLCTPGVSSHFHLLRRRIAMLDKPTVTSHRRSLMLTCIVGTLCIAPLTFVQGQFATPASLKTSSNPMAKSASKKVSAKLAKSATKHTSVVAAKRTQIEGKPSLHVFRLKNADAEKAAAVLRQVLDSGSGGKLAADSKSNSIIVNADEATTAQIANVIKNLEEIDRSESRTPSVPKEPQTVSVYPIKYAEVGNLLQLMHTLYGNPTFAIVKVAADTRTNTLIVTAPENRSQEVRSLIVRLDIPTPTDPDKQKVYRTIKLRFADAKQIVLRVAAMLKNEAPEYMAPDPLSNDIIVRTTEDKCNEVAVLVNFLDHPKQ